MITTKDGVHKVRDQIHDLLGDGLVFFNDMEKRAEYLLNKAQRAQEIESLMSQAKSAYREMIWHARKAHQAMDVLRRTINEVESRAAPH
jgi:hypothetical protein